MESDLIERYAAGPGLLSYAAQGLTSEQARARTGPGIWSIAELVAHMADSDVVGADRMKRVLAEDGPTLLAYDQDAWIARLDGGALPIEDALDLFAANRRWMTAILRRCADGDFARAGEHTENGRMTLAGLLAGYVHHLDHHLRFLYAKRAKLGLTLYPRYGAVAE